MDEQPSRESAEDWRFFQVFGDEASRSAADDIQEVDLLSALDFDETGDYLATGDRGGRVVVFERAADRRANGVDAMNGSDMQYRFLTEFQSHEPEFDYLKSLEIEEKINSLRWCKGSAGCKMLLSTNDKTIKLWKIYGKKIKTVSHMNLDSSQRAQACAGPYSLDGAAGPGSLPYPIIERLRLPIMSTCDQVVTATTKRTYSNAHAYDIKSIAPNSDGETFLSCDDLRVNLWNLNISNSCFNIVDVKPSSMETLTEVITSADAHPIDCHTFMYTSSRGSVRLGDMRAAALCDQHSKVFECVENPADGSFFSEITSSITNARFSPCGRYIAARDYMTVRVWDINMESQPIKTLHVHEHLRPRLSELYENDCIFDKFEVCFNHDTSLLLTGSYENSFHLLSSNGSQQDLTLEASKNPNRKRWGSPGAMQATSRLRLRGGGDVADLSKRILHAAFHPHENVIAVAATSTLYIFRA